MYAYQGSEVNKEGIGEKQRKVKEGKARGMSWVIINGGNNVVNKYDECRSMWKGVGVPYCLCGSEITQYRKGASHS